MRVEVDSSNQKLNYKIRQSNLYKNPYTLIIGDKERDHKEISYRMLGSNKTVTLKVEEFIKKIQTEIKERVIVIDA